MLHSMILYGIILYFTILYNTTLYHTILYYDLQKATSGKPGTRRRNSSSLKAQVTELELRRNSEALGYKTGLNPKRPNKP